MKQNISFVKPGFSRCKHKIRIHHLMFPVVLAMPFAAQAEPALMQPVTDIQISELPPAWLAQPVPVLPEAKAGTQPQQSGAAAPQAVIAVNTQPPKEVTAVKSVAAKPVVKQSPVQQHKQAAAVPKQQSVATPVPTPKSLLSVTALEQMAQRGDMDAAYQLGLRYQFGNGVRASRSMAHKWLSKSAEGGNARGQYALAMFYQQYARNAQGVKKSLFWLKSSADQGLADSQYSLGMMFKNGNLVHQNEAEARKWLQMAARHGHTAAQYALAQ